ncbi:MAG: glycosyltransferase, partial [Sphingomonadaceae bacterium]|nr:glycosyltransferase [Sphingomonadaceae bacterium]
MKHVAFFEPRYLPDAPNVWRVQGGSRYPSILGDLHQHARITLLMSGLPPKDDPHRCRLEQQFGVAFARLESIDDAREAALPTMTADYRDAIAERAPDVVSTLNGRMIGYNFALARAARAEGVDYVYRLAGNDLASRGAVAEAEGRPFYGTALYAGLAAQDRYAMEAARTVIAMGEGERLRAAPIVSDPDKIAVCRRGVDLDHFAPAETAPERCDRFLFVGRDSAEKGIELLERAADLAARLRPAISVSFAGDLAPRDAPQRHYPGFVGYDDLPRLYREHHALVLAASSEGFPQVVMEAMACGRPAILPRALFAQDFPTEDAALLVDLDAEAIAEGMVALHDDPARHAAMREAALAR